MTVTERMPCDDHTYGPSGYVAWHEWAERMAETHDQEQCSGCGLWMIWTPKEANRD